ncbi:hypothetical protein SUGI_0692260 [Cryptomeria japonica]|uniref:BTB/POZ domain-containing protein At1g63850-like n=1 Tax=Cryptomeria japonica TaxID=3369 RepID=UPI002414C7A2|nr:BTB/POZ domain-containing protein At1g63850-like [Cryptomeria japonica]GLJ34427.1 hypothetical protein SUGI_0692260 [Cryptomeria japonica]
MDAHSLEIGDKNDGDVILQIICANGVEYKGNPVYLHSHVLSKSKFFEARLSERWSLHISPPEIKITVIPNGLAEDYIKCISFMYSSYKGRGIHFSGVDEALDIFPIASELLFEEGTQACMHYLEAVPWTRQQSIKINSLLSLLQVSDSADLSARLEISNSFTTEKIELFKKKLPQMLSDIGKNSIPLSMSRLIMEQQLSKIFQGNAFPPMQEVCRDAIINEFSLKIEGIKKSQEFDIAGDCNHLLWLVDITKLCNIEIFKTAFKMFVEDLQLGDILLHKGEFLYSDRARSQSFSNYLLQILVDRFLKGLANGDIIVPKSSNFFSENMGTSYGISDL